MALSISLVTRGFLQEARGDFDRIAHCDARCGRSRTLGPRVKERDRGARLSLRGVR
jgi:hypothetical protein